MALESDEQILLTRTVESCDRLEKSIQELRADYRRKIVRSNVAIAFVALVTALAVFVGYQARETSQRVDQQAKDRAQETLVARRSSCEQFNDQRDALAGAVGRAVTKGLVATATAPITEQQQALLDRLTAGTIAEFLVQYPARDCSDEGIAAYLARGTPTTTR